MCLVLEINMQFGAFLTCMTCRVVSQVLHLVSLDAFGIPTATVYGIVGVLWVFVVAFLLQGFFMAMLTAFISHLLRLPTSSAAKYRVYGADAYLRQIRVCIHWSLMMIRGGVSCYISFKDRFKSLVVVGWSINHASRGHGVVAHTIWSWCCIVLLLC